MYAQREQERPLEPNRQEARRFKKQFQIALTEKDRLTRGDQAAELIEEIARTELDFVESKTAWREKLGGMRTRLREILAAMRARKEAREIEVTEVFDYDRFVVELIDESGEVRDVRPMDAPERQGEFEL